MLKAMFIKNSNINILQQSKNRHHTLLRNADDIINGERVSNHAFLHFLSYLQVKIINFARNQHCVYKIVSI